MFERVSKLLRRPGASELKATPGAFTRSGPLSPELLLTLLVSQAADGNRRGYQLLLDAVWDELKDAGIPVPTDTPVSGPAFCMARRKITPSAMRHLLSEVNAEFEATHGVRHRFRGRRVFAVDGSKVSTQRDPRLWDAFGGPTGGHAPQALVTTLIDVVSKCPLDAVVAPSTGSENAALLELLAHLERGDVLVLDRNFPSYELLESLQDRGIDFVIRVKLSQSFNAIKTFLDSGGNDYRILLGSDAASRPVPALIPVRAVRQDTKNGEGMVLITSLPRRKFSRRDIVALYRMRWEVELMFRIEKSDNCGHKQFHAKTPEGVTQEVLAFLLYLALCRTFQAAAVKSHETPYAEVAERGTLLAVAASLTQLLIGTDESAMAARLEALLLRIARRRTRKRPGRSFPRRSFRPRPKWTAKGTRKK